jgi:hypothetical protein
MPGFATLRLNWDPRMLRILRFVVGLLYKEHGLAKILDFPHQPTHAPYALFTLNPGFVFLYFWVAGGGEWSLDRLRARLHPPYRRAGPERGSTATGPPSICRRGRGSSSG